MRTRLLFALALALPICLALPGAAQKARENTKDEDALAERAKSFIATFEKGDAKALAAFWTADGDYTDQTGKHLKGRAEIEKAFTGLFAEAKGLKLRIESTALRFVTPDVAIEDGITEVIPPDGGPPSRARYTIVHARKDGQWSLSSVRDAAFSPPTNYEHLQPLEWAIGNWVDESDKGEVSRISFEWAQNQNFIVSTFATTFRNITLGGGTQWIGWDPLAKNLRSWSFENSGGFGEGAWERDGESWTIKTTALLPDGKKASSTNTLTRVDANTLLFQVTNRKLDGKAMPDIKEVRMKRRK